MAGIDMHPPLRADITRLLTGDEFRGVDRGGYIQKISCPDCDKREAWAHADNPWMVYCGRLNNCGARFHVKDLFPDLFDSWTERYQPPANAKPNPTAVADGYLRDGRGFDLALIKGTYTQETFWSQQIGAGSTTVRFRLADGVYWERILDKPSRFGSQKANFIGKYKGLAWQLHADDDLIAAREIWIVEGIFDCIALAHAGIRAVSAMAAGNFPGTTLTRLRDRAYELKADRPRLVWALDANRAGREATYKHITRAESMGWHNTAAQPMAGFDWNDLLQRDELREQDIKRYRYYGALLLADTPSAKALLMYKHHERREFQFEYSAQRYAFKLDMEAYNKALREITGDEDAEAVQPMDHERHNAIAQAATINRICTANPVALYYQAHEATDEAWYYWRVDAPGGAVKNTFTGAQLASVNEFKKRLLSVSPGAVWTGTAGQLDRLLQDQLNQIKTVATIDYVGYSKEHGVWLLGDTAIAKGRVLHAGDEDYFQMGRLRIKSLSRSPEITINADREQFGTGWVNDLVGAWGARGTVALAYWLGSLFAEQIRAQFGSFPFLEIVGEPATGKTRLLEFLWSLVGRADYEGFDPSKATPAGRARSFAQVANLPVVLIESDREGVDAVKQRQFDWDELKTAYNGRALRARGMKTGGNETYEPPFRGAVVIAQNAPVQASDAIQTRICHLKMVKADQTPASKDCVDRLSRLKREDVSGFALVATTAEKDIMVRIIARVPKYEAYLLDQPEIREPRIAHNHAMLLVLIECLGPEGLQLINQGQLEAAQQRARAMAGDRQTAINADHPVVEEFWEAFDYIESLYEGPALNHLGPYHDQIAINIKDFESQCAQHKVGIPPAKELKKYLGGSRSRRFVQTNKCVHSRVREGSTVRCWIFDKPEANRDDS